MPPCGWGEAQACEAAYDPAITMLGARQEQWLYAGLSSGTRWNAFGNNVMIARLDHDGAAGDLLWNDAWDGFPAARNRLLDEVVARDVHNAVFVTGDWHSTFVNHVKQDFDAPDSPVVASEFVGTSVSTNGDGIVYGPYYGPMIRFNPHIKYFDGDRRGYQRHTLTADTWRTDLVMVDRSARRPRRRPCSGRGSSRTACPGRCWPDEPVGRGARPATVTRPDDHKQAGLTVCSYVVTMATCPPPRSAFHRRNARVPCARACWTRRSSSSWSAGSPGPRPRWCRNVPGCRAVPSCITSRPRTTWSWRPSST